MFDSRFLYSLLLGADANFRMVRKKVSSEEADPTLSPGWSYYCEVTKYNEHLATGVEKEEVRTLSFLTKHFLISIGTSERTALNVC
jgi:hypothetical protein